MSKKLVFRLGVFLITIFMSLGFYVFKVEAADPDIQEVWTSSGDNQAEAIFGVPFESAGDVNGDGYDDLIVGAYLFDTDVVDAGRAYLYLGGVNGLSTDPVWTSSGDNHEEDFFGSEVSAVGDINNDGYDDVAIGAYSTNSRGKVFLFLGDSSGLSATPIWTSSGDDQVNAFFGFSISGAGDTNSDGYDDVIIGAYGNDTFVGKVFLYLGSSSGLSVVPAWTSSGDVQEGASFGIQVGSAGDVNNDGYNDVLVGAPGYVLNESVLGAGKAYLYLGSSSGLAIMPSWISSGDNQADANFGERLSAAGDVNKDGYDDFLVSAFVYDTIYEDAGRVYLYLGGATVSSIPVWTSNGDNQANAEYGRSISSLDINADGYSDVLVGSLATDNTGKSYLYLGNSAGLLTVPFWTSSGENQVGANFGRWVSGLGDFNGDGFDGFAVSAPQFDTANANAGKLYVYANQNNIFEENIVLRPGLNGKELDGEGLLIYFKNLPRELTCGSNYWMNWKKFNKYPKKWTNKKKTALKRYWRLKTNLKNYKPANSAQKYQIQVTFKYSKKLWKRLKKKDVWKNQLRLKYKTKKGKKWQVLTKHWKAAKVKHFKKERQFRVRYFQKFKKTTYYFAIGKK